MKKTFLLVASISLITLNSCKKDYSCRCVDTDDQYTSVYPIVDVTESDALEYCDGFNADYTSYSTVCELEE